MPRDRHGRADRTRDGHPFARAGRSVARLGVGLVAVALPLSVATLVSVLLSAPTLTAGVDAAVAAATGPLSVGGGGVAWLLHAGVLGVLAGSWLVGLGLVLTGLFD